MTKNFAMKVYSARKLMETPKYMYLIDIKVEPYTNLYNAVSFMHLVLLKASSCERISSLLVLLSWK